MRKFRHVHSRRVKFDLSGIGPRYGQKALYQAGKAVDLLKHAADNVAIVGDAAGFLKCHFAYAADSGQRSSEFMRRIGCEAS